MKIVSKQRLILGTGQADDIRSGAGQSVIFAGAGDDAVRAGDGAQVADGGDGRDTIWASAGSQTISGGASGDTLDTSFIDGPDVGRHLLYGDEGNDLLSAAQVTDTVFGDAGDEYLYREGRASPPAWMATPCCTSAGARR